MADTYWRLDEAGERRGPETRDEIIQLILSGRLGAGTLVWTTGMNEWRAAGEIDDLRGSFGALPPAPPPTPGSPFGAGSWPAQGASGALRTEFPVWGLFWRAVVVGVAGSVVIFWPWATAWFNRWLAGRVRLPNGARLVFTGTGGQIAFPFFGLIVGMIVLAGLSAVVHLARPLFAALFGLGVLAFGLWVIRWKCSNTSSEDGALKIVFSGRYLPFVGWWLLFYISFVTIIGWAWVLAAMLRWIARNVEGTHRFAFVGSGAGILWRTVVGMLCCYLIIPIPWIMRWLYSWYLSKVEVA